MTNLVITKERWEALIQKTKHVHNYSKECGADIEDYEINLILSVLKNNVPFEVIESIRQEIKDKSVENKPFDVVEK